jgi:hypothetical protein
VPELAAQESVRASRRLRLLALILGAGLWMTVLGVVAMATRLRPIADDYCHAAVGVIGYLPSLGVWYATWIGDLFQVSVTALLVGQPLIHLPFSVASMIPFLFTALGVLALSLIVVMRSARASRRDATVAVFVVSPLILVLWWASWWVPVTLSPDQGGVPFFLATAVTDWQVVNVQYVLVPAILIGAWLLIADRTIRPEWARIAVVAILGLCSGTGGLVFGVAALGFVVALWVWRYLERRAWDRAATLSTIVFGAACLAGLVIAYLSPGAQGRADLLAVTRPVESISPLTLLGWMFPQAIYNWLGIVVHISALLVVVVGIGIAFLLRAVGVVPARRTLLRTSAGFLTFSLVLTLAVRAGDAFSYTAFWHDVMPRLVVLVALTAAGVALGDWLAGILNRTATYAVSLVVVLAVVVALGSLFAMYWHVVERTGQWDAGPAPAGGAVDLSADWVDSCWKQLGETRELPDRGE